MRASSRARTMAGSSRSKVGARSPNLRKAIVDQAREMLFVSSGYCSPVGWSVSWWQKYTVFRS